MTMQKFGFSIQTKSGTSVENLIVHARDLDHAETKLRQIYHHCKIIESRTIDVLTRGEGTDLESAIGLIVGQDSKL